MGFFDSKKPPAVQKRQYNRKPKALDIEKAAVVSGLHSIIKSEILGFNVTNFDYAASEGELSRISQYNPWVSASIRAIVRNSIQPALKTYDPATNDDAQEPEFSALLQQPHPLFNWSKWLKFNVFYNIHSGVSYNYIIRNESGKVIALQPLPPENVLLDQAALALGQVKYFINLSGDKRQLDASDLMIWQDFEYVTSYYTGTSRLKHLLFSIHNKNAADLYNKGSFESGGLVKGILSTEQKLNPNEARQIKEQWKSNTAGQDAGGIGVIGQGTKYQSTGQTNSEMGFEQLQKVSQQEVNAVYHVPSIEMGLDTSNYATAKEQRKLFWETMMIPLMDSFAEVLTEFLQREYKTQSRAYFDYSSIQVMQNDLNTKLQSAQIMQFLGYDNETITNTLDLPALENTALIVPADQQPAKSLVKNFEVQNGAIYQIYRQGIKGSFLAAHGVNEKKFEKYLRQYFYEQRNQILDFIKSFYNQKAAAANPGGAFREYWSKQGAFWNNEIIDAAGKYFNNINSGMVRDMIEKYQLKFYDGVKSQIKINNHMQKIVGINETTDKQTWEAIQAAYDEGIKTGMSQGEIADSIVRGVKDVFKVAENRALLIARTETTSVANDLFRTNFEENGIDQKEWLTSQDELVRNIPAGDSFDHVIMDGVTVGMSEYFSVPGKTGANQIQQPGDMVHGEAGNVCNCRCTILPK